MDNDNFTFDQSSDRMYKIAKELYKKNSNKEIIEELLLKCINQKHFKSHLLLSRICEEGKIVERNYKKGIEYLKLALEIKKDIKSIHFKIAMLLYKITPLNRKEILYHLMESLEDDKLAPEVNYKIGDFFLTGLNDNQYKEYKKAEVYLLKALELGNKKAACKLGNIYALGLTDQINSLKALEYFKISADHGSNNGCYNLASMYKKGLGVDKDIEKSMYYYKISAHKRHKPSLSVLSKIYSDGVDLPVNKIIAGCYYKIEHVDKVEPILELSKYYKQGMHGLKVNILYRHGRIGKNV
eukprot:TRINITY_DN15561_c0_g1_i1.p1 TRINITY_DN15561_c0_g1~~TRINITY_DN15561_c0_g1_i1.p1  ORF type:complete len:297 (-),score=47.77 TRINITY_DN15561_c0_g1_i1:99-989(-)